MSMLAGKHILLVITGGIAAYKALELIRLIQKQGGSVQAILTRAATEFVTPLSVSALSGHPALTSLFDLTQETRIGHIELSRSADLIVVAPASADFLAKLAHGMADDLASTCLLATDTPILCAPAMNVRMWQAAATQRNMTMLRGDGVSLVGPDDGPMACGEFGPGRLAEPAAILAAMEGHFGRSRSLAGRRIIVTSGPTREALDPVRYISNTSSGRQGAAIAEALARRGAEVVFVTGPAEADAPPGCRIVPVVSARDMQAAVMDALPADAAVFVAAVADWRAAEPAPSKLKKQPDAGPPAFRLVPNPDILAEVAHLAPPQRPALVVGFAAETEDLLANARAKHQRKACDWLLANSVGGDSGTLGGTDNHVHLLTGADEENWGALPKTVVGERLADRMAAWFSGS
jgi:phosphopantothenoylcysteine decarboxylase / phosphopantothenate---cysteine ligase